MTDRMNANYRRNEKLINDLEIPAPGVAQAGKVMMVGEDGKLEYGAVEVPTYSAGTGIDITEGVISNSAPVPAYTTSEDGKILGVTVDSSGETPVAEVGWVNVPNELPTIASGDAGKILAVNAGETGTEWVNKLAEGYVYLNAYTLSYGTSIQPNTVDTSTFNLTDRGAPDYDFILVARTMVSGVAIFNTMVVGSGAKTVNISVKNCTKSAINGNIAEILIYRRPKVSSFNSILLIGATSSACIRASELPDTLGTAGQVLAVNSGATGVEWVTPAGMTAHTYSTWGAFITDYIAHTDAIIGYFGCCNINASITAGTPYSCKFVRPEMIYLVDNTIRQINWIFTETADSTNTNASMVAKGFTYDPANNTFTAYSSDSAGQASVSNYRLYY